MVGFARNLPPSVRVPRSISHGMAQNSSLSWPDDGKCRPEKQRWNEIPRDQGIETLSGVSGILPGASCLAVELENQFGRERPCHSSPLARSHATTARSAARSVLRSYSLTCVLYDLRVEMQQLQKFSFLPRSRDPSAHVHKKYSISAANHGESQQIIADSGQNRRNRRITM